MNIYLIGLIIPILSFCLQIWPRLVKRYFGVDTWKWLFFADYVRRHKKLPAESTKRYIANSVYGYPPLIILLLSKLPKKFLERYQFICSPFFDFLNNYLTFQFALILSNDIKTAVITQIIAALTPIIVIEASNLNTRVLSYLIFNISFLPLFLFTLTLQPLWLIISGIGLSLLFFTHRFAIQAYIVTIIGFTLFERNIFYTLYFIFIFGLVYIFGGKLYKAILNEHIVSLKYWIDKIDYRFAHQIRGLTKKTRKEDFIQKAYNLSFKGPLLYAFANNPWLVLVFLIAINSQMRIFSLSSTIPDLAIKKSEIWVGSLFVCAVLVLAVKKLRNFGDGHRYLEYCVLPVALIISSYCSLLINKFGLISYIYIFFACTSMICLIIFLQYKAVVLDKSRSVTKEVWKIINYINTHKPTKITLAMFPLQLGDAMLYFTKCRILSSDTYFGLEKLNDFYPILRKPMTEIIKKYKINHIYLDKNFVQLEELKLKKYKILLDIDDYVLLKV